jgi:hypothetical protein
MGILIMAQPTAKNVDIRNLQSNIVGCDVVESIVLDKCVVCKGPATEFKDEISRKEFSISGLCQICQDKVFNYDDE